VSERTVPVWFKRFRDGDESLEDEEQRGRPSDVDNDLLKSLVEDNPRKSTRELSADLNVDPATVTDI